MRKADYSKIMNTKKFEMICKEKIVEYFNANVDPTDNFHITVEDVFTVWMCKTLQNNKALLSTTVLDGMYYEITYNGDKKELYFDAYKKFTNKCFKDVE